MWIDDEEHRVMELTLEPIYDRMAVVAELRKLMRPSDLRHLMKACQGERPLYTYDSQAPEASGPEFMVVLRVVERLGLKGTARRYLDGAWVGDIRLDGHDAKA